MDILIIIFVVYIFFPILLLSILSGIILVIPKHKKKILSIAKYFFGFTSNKRKYSHAIRLQNKSLDCGEAAFKNVLELLNIQYSTFSMHNPVSGEDIKKKAQEYNLIVTGYENIDIIFLKQNLSNTKKILVLLKVTYVYDNAWWFLPTSIFFKFIVGKIISNHWITVDYIDEQYVGLIDPFWGSMKIKNKKFLKMCSGAAVTLEKTS